ncbi:uncharacterized protein LOC142160573 [Mixophyes fleayi]|uniref:uncharacterized protein LOC142160573 n=1 Tax=Mixophyes fleayi TaxID=3061075 RepID=UPI003F4DFB6F
MSSPVDDVTTCSNDSVEYTPSEYPISTASSTVPPVDQQWNNCSSPPAYETLGFSPTQSVHETTSQLNTPPTVQQWNMHTQRSAPNVPSVSQILNNSHTADQQNIQGLSPTHDIVQTSQILVRSTNSEQWNMQMVTPAHDAPPSSLALNGPTAALQQNTDALIPERTTDFKHRFRNGKPRALGILLILAAIVQIGVGIGLAYSKHNYLLTSLSYGIPFWSPAVYILAGSLLIEAWAKPSIFRVKRSGLFSLIAFVISLAGLVFNFLDLQKFECSLGYYDFYEHSSCQHLYSNTYKVFLTLIGTNVLALLLSISTACIGNNAVRYAARINRLDIG